MARNLILKENVQTPDMEYPYGRIKDDTGAADGTPVNEEVYGDFHQFFAKLMAVSGIAYNDLPDNAYDGFQYYDALAAVIQLGIDLHDYNQTIASWTNVTFANNWIHVGGSNHNVSYMKDPQGWVHIRGKAMRSDAATGNNVGMFLLPTGYRPAKDEAHAAVAASPLGYGGAEAIYITISSTGSVAPVSMLSKNVLLLLNQAGDFVSLDGIRFKAG